MAKRKSYPRASYNRESQIAMRNNRGNSLHRGYGLPWPHLDRQYRIAYLGQVLVAIYRPAKCLVEGT